MAVVISCELPERTGKRHKNLGLVQFVEVRWCDQLLSQSSLDMSSLSIFPTEILEWITDVVTTSQQMRLWQCGDRILNLKLKNGGLKRTSLCWPGHTWMPWPRWYFTTFGGIVDVEWSLDIGSSFCPTLELNLLPKTLKRLHLACNDVFLLLSKQKVNMNELLPTLELLYLSGDSLSEENLKNLPSDLIELHVASAGVKMASSNLFGDLPRLIARLTLLFDIVDEQEVGNELPSDLISVEIFRLECTFNWVSKLPKSLKTLIISKIGFDVDWGSIPRQLEKMKMGDVDPYFEFPTSAIAQLPQSLKTFEARGIYAMAYAGDEIRTLLPKHLTRLSITHDSTDHSLLQPLSTTHESADHSLLQPLSTTHESADHPLLPPLPTSLTDLDVRISATHPDILSFYPPDAITIRLCPGPFGRQLNLFPFPTKLLTLQLCHINDAICAMLPYGLRTLDTDGGLITMEGASKLPKSLTSLHAPIAMFNDNETMSYLGHLSNIHLMVEEGNARNDKLNDFWISSLLPSASSPTILNQSRPLNDTDINLRLTSLTISLLGGFPYKNFCPHIQKPFFDALPKMVNLNTLFVYSIGDISSDWLWLIPQNLTFLKIGYLSAFPTETQLSMLPKRLTHLDLKVMSRNVQRCDWNDESLLSLPRSLQYFAINGPFPNLTQRMVEYLPPNLGYTTLQYVVQPSSLLRTGLQFIRSCFTKIWTFLEYLGA